MSNTKYNTAAREAVIGFFASDPDRQFTTEQVFEGITRGSEGKCCGKSTVYRLIGKLCDEGILRRYRGESENTALYQYISDADCHRHFHMKCLKCGRVFHLECPKSHSLMEHILKEHGFRIDSGSSMLYGQCENCGK